MRSSSLTFWGIHSVELSSLAHLSLKNGSQLTAHLRLLYSVQIGESCSRVLEAQRARSSIPAHRSCTGHLSGGCLCKAGDPDPVGSNGVHRHSCQNASESRKQVSRGTQSSQEDSLEEGFWSWVLKEPGVGGLDRRERVMGPSGWEAVWTASRGLTCILEQSCVHVGPGPNHMASPVHPG